MVFCESTVTSYTLADIFYQAGFCLSVGWLPLLIGIVIMAFVIFLAQSRVGLPASLVVFNILGFAFFLFGSPWDALFYAILIADAVVIGIAVIQFTKQ